MTIETHGMQFVLDASGVEKGFRNYEAAVEGIFKSLDKFEAKVASTMKGIESAANNKAALASFRKSLDGFSNIKIDTQAARKLSALSAAMAGFKAPSAAQAANTRKFFTSLEKLPDLSEAFRSIKNLGSLKASLESFKAPPMTQAKNLREFANSIAQAAPQLRALNGIRGVSGIANELATISIAMRGMKVPTASQIANLGNMGLALQHLGRVNTGQTGQMMHALAGINNFKAPTQANIRNLLAFANALHQIKPIQNAGQIANSMVTIAMGANRANAALGGFRRNLGGFNPAYGRFNAGTHAATLNMMGLQNAFSGTFQIGSALRTMLGSLTIGELGRSFFDATNAALQFRAQMGVLSKDTKFADVQLQYINDTARSFGMDMLTAEAGFAKISIAAQKAGMSVLATRDMFEGFSTEMTVLGTSTERQNDVWLAVQQVMNKGYLSAEELNQQLNEHLPGAMAYAAEMADKMGMSLQTALKKKALDASDTLAYMAKRMKEDFGPSVALALERPAAQMNILRGNIDQLFQTIGDNGVNAAVGRMLAGFNDALNPNAVKDFATAIGHSLAGAVDRAAAAFGWLRANWDSIKGPLSTTLSLMGKWMMLSAAFNIGRYLISPILMLRTQLVALSTRFAGASTAGMGLSGTFTRLTAGTTPLLTGLGRLNFVAQAQIASVNALKVAWNGVKMAGNGLLSLVGGPMGAAMLGVGVIVGTLTSRYMNMQGVLMDTNNVIQDNIRYLREQANAAAVAGGETAGVGSFAAGAAPKITAFAGQVGEAAQQLWNMANAARAARLEQLVGQINRTRESMRDLSRFDMRTFGQDKGDLHSVANFFGNGWDRAVSRIGNLLTSGDQQRDLQQKFKTLGQQNAELTQQLRDFNKTPLEAFAPKMPEVPKLPDHSTTKDGKGRHKDPMAEVKKTENAVDDLMKRLNAGDPIEKLYSDFVANIGKEAKTLLSIGGFKEFFAEVKAGSGSAAEQTQALIHVLQSGKGLNDKTISDLKARYHKDIPGIIDLLKAQLSDLQDAAVEAAAKSLEATYRGVIKARKAFGEFDPLSKLNDETVNKIKPIAEQLFKGDTQAFNDFYEPLLNGSQDATTGIAALRRAMIEATDPASKLHGNFVAMGKTAEEATRIVTGLAQQFAYLKAQEEENLVFGAKLLRQKDEELMLMSLSVDQAEIMKDLQQEVNDKIASGHAVNAQMIADLKEELVVRKALANQMQRNKDFFDNNGVRTYLNDIQDVGSAINDLDKNFLQSLEDQLYNLGTTGEFSFNKIFDTIQQGIVRMAAQGIVQNFTHMIFGQGELDGGTPSIFGGTIGKLFGGYKPSQVDKLGSSGANPLWVKWAGDFNAMGVSTRDGSLLNHPEKAGQALLVGGDQGGILGPPIGSSPMQPMFVRDADKALTGGIPAFGGSSFGGSGGVDPLAPLPESGSIADQNTVNGATAGVGGQGNPAEKAGAAVANSFQSNMASVIPMIGMMFAGSFKSPIARIGVMFLSMMLSQMMSAQAAGGAGGGGGIGGMISSILPKIFGGAKEGGIVGQFVNSYAVSPAAFINAPHYRDGTPNTSGGIPAILHDNEAVIPLSRGRKVPVELTNGSSGDNKRPVQVNFNVNSPDADSFRKSKQQIMTDLHAAAARAYNRNN